MQPYRTAAFDLAHLTTKTTYAVPFADLATLRAGHRVYADTSGSRLLVREEVDPRPYVLSVDEQRALGSAEVLGKVASLVVERWTDAAEVEA